jgi:predicted nucleic acid-binding protein
VIVYAESNFLLELAYLQEEHEACEQILALAEAGRVQLRIPAFCAIEARMSLARRVSERKQFSVALLRQIRELARSKPHSALPDQSSGLTSALIASGEEERKRLDAALARITSPDTILPTTSAVLGRAEAAQARYELSPQDALVYASVAVHAERTPDPAACFLTRNSKDFADPEIREELARAGCKLLFSFSDGLGYANRPGASPLP